MALSASLVSWSLGASMAGQRDPDPGIKAMRGKISMPQPSNNQVVDRKPRRFTTLRSRLRRLYFGSDSFARFFRLSLLGLDVALLLYFVIGSFYFRASWHEVTDIIIAALLVVEWIARLWIYDARSRFFMQAATWSDVIVIVSLILPIFDENFLFLRVLRFMRLFHSYHVLRDLREVSTIFRNYEEVIEASISLIIFIFVMSAIVFLFQVRLNPGIDNYVDALYFTVTTLTTTGYGDIVMRDTMGRLLAVAIMIAGFGLFLRLVQAIFRPSARRIECPDCGLLRHDHDAVHCKHCGRVINIKTEGHDY
jgi:voltage-gated potassium channel